MSALPQIPPLPLADRPSFRSLVGRDLLRTGLQTLQINVGKLCNQACLHCHVEAGPKRTEIMTSATVDRLLELLDLPNRVRAVDITGGAPEMNPDFRRLVVECRQRGLTVIDRCNLTVLLIEGQEDTAEFLAAQGVEVVASLPCYSEANVDKQRGKGVFGQSIEALRRLNALGYGKPGSGLVLNLVYNPVGPFLPPAQESLQADYHQRLYDDFGIVFNELFTITNMPIARFRYDLERAGALQGYMETLVNAFNPATVDGVMCRDQVSVSWDGRLFDCDFNQMLEIPAPAARTIFDVTSLDDLVGARIEVADHCLGCTAGAGSSCGGALS